MSSVHRIGFTELKGTGGARSGTVRANIIFIHGLEGHPQRTWEETRDMASPEKRSWFHFFPRSSPRPDEDTEFHSPSLFWPDEFLTKDIPDARIWTYGYDADVLRFYKASNKNTVSQHGNDLALELEREFDNKTSAIIFLGTPHRGSDAASWATLASNLAALALCDSNKRLTGALQPNGEVFDNIHTNFVKLVDGSGIRLHSFQEARGMTGVKGLSSKVVDEDSSKMGLAVEACETINADHRQMARCCSREDPRYRKMLAVLKQCMRSIKAEHSAVLQEMGLVAKLVDIFSSDDGQTAAIAGLGGIGKTQTALHIAYWAKENLPMHSVFWVAASSHASFEQACSEIVKTAGLSKSTENEDSRETVRRHLSSSNAGKWLLVVDNADDERILFGAPENPGGINKYLPAVGCGHVLFTTRYVVIANKVVDDIDNVVDLDVMDLEDATSLWESCIRKDLGTDKDSTATILRQLDCIPLAIKQATAYINATRLPASQYLSRLRDMDHKIVALMSKKFLNEDSSFNKSQTAVATTWLVSFEQVQALSNDAAKLLAFISCIDPKGIPQSILPAPANKDLESAIDTLF
ncbi:hypothetical protein SCUCBS95973_007455 [Sporothrix curviconia]|uniref:NB-ARC domain-containing protein n=1 Tax=Sporothrix curviconia TaxID=1260050 RepID=A0ABP0CE34_9PEZI